MSITALRSWRRVLLGAVGLVAAGCAMAPPAACDLAGVQGQMLRLKDLSNAACLDAARQRLDALAVWTDREGPPDYMKVESARLVRIFYIERDEIVTFKRPMFVGETKAIARNPIRSDYYVDFINVDRERLGKVRLGTGSRPVARPKAAGAGIKRKRVGGDEEEDERTPR